MRQRTVSAGFVRRCVDMYWRLRDEQQEREKMVDGWVRFNVPLDTV